MPPPSRSVSSSRRPAELPAAPPDLWLHLHKIPSGDWSQLRDLGCPDLLDMFDPRDILHFLTTYSSELHASVNACLPYIDDEVMPSALVSFHQGLSRAVASLDEDAVIDNGLDGVSWPPDAFSSTTPLSLTKAEARNLEHPHPKPYATFKAPAPPSSSSFPGLRPPTAPSSLFPGSGYPYGPLLPPADVEMGPPEDADAKRDRLMASLSSGPTTPDAGGRAYAHQYSSSPKPALHRPGSRAAQSRGGRSAGESDSSAMPPPSSASVSASSRRQSLASDTSKATVPGVIKVKRESGQQPSGGKEKEKKKAKGKGTQNAPMEISDPEIPPNTKVTRSQVPGAKPAVPLKETLELPPHATEEEAGGAGSSKHKGKAAKIQDKGKGGRTTSTPTKQFAADRPHKTEEGKSLNKNIFSMLISLLPDQARLDLPRTDDGRYYKITYDLVRQVLRIGDPHFGPRCNFCQLSGGVCRSRGSPAMCDACSRLHGTKICNLCQPDEINSDAWGAFMAYTDMSSDRWRQITEGLTRSFGALESLEAARTNLLTEYHFNLLSFLVIILRARRELAEVEFWERFSSQSAGEMLLRVAMAQQLTADTEVTRAYVWQYYEYEHLHLDLPVFESAYNFYRTFDDASRDPDPVGYYLVPASEIDDVEPRWEPVSGEELRVVKKDNSVVPTGVRSKDICRRFRHEAALAKGNATSHKVLRDSDGTQFPHGTGLKRTGFLHKLWDAYTGGKPWGICHNGNRGASDTHLHDIRQASSACRMPHGCHYGKCRNLCPLCYGLHMFDLEAEEGSDESSGSGDSEPSDAESLPNSDNSDVVDVVANRPSKREARRQRRDAKAARSGLVLLLPAQPQASSLSPVVVEGEVKRAIVRRRTKPKTQPKSNEMVVDSGGE
ncbi:hypothetical protein DFH06DRAFT_1318236 [Mycena polygramma]|nr:hypothetical protein DFH06DRAFT_1318236 [Mycena polygramma]